MKIFYSDKYFAEINEVMPIGKFKMVKNAMLATGQPFDLCEPEPVSDTDLMRVHTKKYIDAIKTGQPESLAERQLFPWSYQLADSVRYTNGGCIGAAYAALEDGISGNLASGFHHADASSGSAFCTFNGLAVGIRRLQADGKIKRAMVVDCDLHYGNGTAGIFAGSGDSSVATLSVCGVSWDERADGECNRMVKLKGGSGRDEYLGAIEKHLPTMIKSFCPEFIFYQAGADPYREDPMSNLDMGISDLAERDRMVFQIAKSSGIPIAYVLAGGYPKIRKETSEKLHAESMKRIVGIHTNTFLAAKMCGKHNSS